MWEPCIPRRNIDQLGADAQGWIACIGACDRTILTVWNQTGTYIVIEVDAEVVW